MRPPRKILDMMSIAVIMSLIANACSSGSGSVGYGSTYGSSYNEYGTSSYNEYGGATTY